MKHKLINLLIPLLIASGSTTADEKSKGIYITSWVAGSKYGQSLIEKVKQTELNTIVIDGKDATGHVTYDTDLWKVEKIGAEDIRISKKKLEGILEDCKKNDIYTIARIVVAKDPVLASAYQNKLAILDKETGKYSDWVDLFSYEVMDYNLEIASELEKMGFDEINFDYLRFPDIKEVKKPDHKHRTIYWGRNAPLYKAVCMFLQKANNLLDCNISVDVYAYTVWGDKARHMNEKINNIGQVVELMGEHVDYIYPMIYPSHFSKADQEKIVDWYKNKPLEYAVIYDGCIKGKRRTKDVKAKIVPWIQGFQMGKKLDANYIKNEIQAVKDSGIEGYLIWNSKNNYKYVWEALKEDPIIK